MNNEQKEINTSKITFKILNARLGCSKEVISSINNPNFRIKFSLRNNKKLDKGIKYSKTIPLKDSMMFFDKDAVYFDNIDEDNDTILIAFQTLEKYDLKTEYTSIKIHVKDLDKAKEIDVVWTLAKQSFMNIMYQITKVSLPKLPLTLEKEDISSNVYISTNPNDITPPELDYGNLGYVPTTVDEEKVKSNHANKTPSLFSAAKSRFSLKSARKSIDIFKSLETIPINLKKSKTTVIEHTLESSPSYEILESNCQINDSDSIYSCDYISKLNYEEIDYDTFCHCIFVSGLNRNNTGLIPQSEEYPSPCQHKECSILSAFQSSILHQYQNDKKKNKQIDISDLTANLCFPLGIKLCFHADNRITSPKPYKTFLNIIKNEKGDNYYIVTLHYFRIMSVEDFDKKYKLNPLKEYTKFLNYDKNNYNEAKFTFNLKIISDFIGNETVLIPESITLVSRFPYVNQMAYCLRTLITLEPNEMNSMINHIINEVPIPSKMKKIKFYLPYNHIPIELASPFMPNIANSYHRVIFEYLSIENIIFIFNLILLEQKVLFIENNYQILSGITLAFISFIYPFNWMNTYIPVLSLISIQFLQSIIPFIMGTDEFLFKYSITNEYIEENQKNVYINIRTNTIFLSPLLKKKVSKKQILKELDIPELPEKIVSFLTGKLKDIKKHLNDKIPIANIEEQIKEAFCETMARMIGDYKVNMFITDNNDSPSFNSECYLSTKKKEERRFYSELIQTQLFVQFLFNEKQISCKASRKLNECITKYGVLYDSTLVDTSHFKTLNKEFIQSKMNKNNKKNIKNANSKISSPSILRSSSKPKIQALSPSSILSSNKDNSTANTIKKDLSGMSQDEITKPKNTILLSSYFINDSKIYTDKTKIEAFITDKSIIKNNNKDVTTFSYDFLIEDTKEYHFDSISDSYRRYFLNEHTFISKTNSRRYTRSNIKKRSLSSTCLNNKTKGLQETKILSDLFSNICISETKEKITQYDIVPILNSEENRHFFSIIIKQPDYDYDDADQASFAGLENDDYPCKMLNIFCFSELAKCIKLALSNLTENEYYTCKNLTSSCFTYFKVINKKRIYIYEEYPNLYQFCKLWLEEDFWINWFLDNNNTNTNIQNDDFDSQILLNIKTVSKRLIQLENIMIKLHMKKEFVKNVIIDLIARKYFDNESLMQFQEGFNQRTYLL